MAYASFRELEAEAHASDVSLGAAAILREAEESGMTKSAVRARLDSTLTVMQESLAEGLAANRRSRYGLTGQDAALLAASSGRIAGPAFCEALAGSLAVAELNAAMGRIVAAPTGGSCGVVPGVLLATAGHLGSSRERLVEALATAGAVGAVIASRATLSGAAAGCQAEIGAASALSLIHI